MHEEDISGSTVSSRFPLSLLLSRYLTCARLRFPLVVSDRASLFAPQKDCRQLAHTTHSFTVAPQSVSCCPSCIIHCPLLGVWFSAIENCKEEKRYASGCTISWELACVVWTDRHACSDW